MRYNEQDVLVLALEVTHKELEPSRSHSSRLHGLPHLWSGYCSSGTLPAQTWKVSKFQLTYVIYTFKHRGDWYSFQLQQAATNLSDCVCVYMCVGVWLNKHICFHSAISFVWAAQEWASGLSAMWPLKETLSRRSLKTPPYTSLSFKASGKDGK